jgi:pentatricopeptide repeat protein
VKRVRPVLGIAALAVWLAPAVVSAQEPLLLDHTSTTAGAMLRENDRLLRSGQGMPELDTNCPLAGDLGGTDVERAAICFLEREGPDGERHFVSTRTLAERALRDDARSFRAHYVMGVVQHQGEGNLPKSLHHLERAEQLFIETYGERPSMASSPWKVFHRILIELVYVHGEMDHHLEKIRYVDLLHDRLGLDYSFLKSWPLLKLERFDEARLIAFEAASHQEEYVRAVGLTALCAVESEQRRRQEAYEACKAAAQPIMSSPTEGAIELSNAAAAASEVFKLDEAERYYLDATRRRIEGSVNPWGRLVRLYLREGRFAEALSAWREMRKYRAKRPKYLDQQDESDADLIGAAVLIIAGRASDAVAITERTVHRPDRQGTSSAQAEQNEAGAAIMDRVVKLDVARQLEEEASSAKLGEALELRLQALKLRLEAWASGRRAAEVLADRARLVTSLRPECPGSIELPEWLDADVIHIVGPGVALAAIEEARAEETLPPEQADLVFRALEAEAQLLAGDDAIALENATWVVEHYGASEALLRARAAAIGARAAENLGAYDRARELLAVVLTSDPGLIRRLGHTLPVVFTPSSEPEAQAALEHLRSSPLFDEAAWGFELRISAGSASLVQEDGSELLSVHFAPPTGPDEDAKARRLARAIHHALLVPNVDVTQADIRSLDGSMGTGGRADERVKSVLDEVMGR